MPLVAVVGACIRRWYVLAFGLLMTLGVMLAVHDRPGVYYSQVQVVLVGPTQTYYPNTFAQQPFSLSPMASILVSDWNGKHRPLLTSSSDTTLYGEGVREGTEVRLPNQGSQFVPSFTAPYVEVQVVGSEEAEVTARAASVVKQLKEMLLQRQERAGVPERSQITTLLAPGDVSAVFVPARTTRALGVTLGLGMIGTAVLCTGADRVLEGLTRRRR